MFLDASIGLYFLGVVCVCSFSSVSAESYDISAILGKWFVPVLSSFVVWVVDVCSVFCLSTPFLMVNVSGIIPPMMTCALLVRKGCAANVVPSCEVKNIQGRTVSWERSIKILPPYVVGSEENWHLGFVVFFSHLSVYSL